MLQANDQNCKAGGSQKSFFQLSKILLVRIVKRIALRFRRKENAKAGD